jgi:type IV pilus assembly protein PilB
MLVPPQMARTHQLLPVAVIGDRLRVATANPLDLEPLDLLQRTTRLRPEPLYADEVALAKAIETHYGGIAVTSSGETLDDMLGDISAEKVVDERASLGEMIQASEQAPVIKMVNLLLTEAIRAHASDIHIEPRRDHVEVRHRVDGVLSKVRVLPKSLQAACASRLKIMAELDISERRLPQDGRIPIVIENRSLDLRVSTLPTHYGERVVLRILDKGAGIRGLDTLDFYGTNLLRFESLIRRPFGIILVTGPTGSGKTTTLYSALDALRDETTNIITCEDPIEYDMDGINQSAVNDRAGLTFARQLRAILRQDPDIVLVGEIRDAETAEIAFRAAMTGHLVLSTLHSNDAPTSVTRLIDMGVPPFLIASGLIGVVAQRLARRLCRFCRRQAPPTAAQIAALDLAPDDPIWHAVGCAECLNKGYQGRIGVHEVLISNEAFGRMVMNGEPGSKLRAAAADGGMVSMRDDGLAKVRAGLTSTEEVLRRVCIQAE